MLFFVDQTGIVTATIVVYDFTAICVRAMRFIWITISLDIVIIMIRASCIVRLAIYMHIRDDTHGWDQNEDMPQVVALRIIKIALLAASGTGL